MAYVALYRKFRPQRFSDLVGQEHIVRTLLNQLESGRIAHAYLFAGPRGTGKTSTAKLFARAINCASPQNGDPCGKCDACIAAQADDNMDIIEIDAASNNGVDNIRDIREKVVFAPAYGKYKVYIIDEVHMLSGGAFNALLKTLEEPPAHVVFILATTELHKLPATILSRCQRFDFKLISAQVISQRLKNVLTLSGAQFEDNAIDLIAKTASGGMRDALSLADVCLSYCGNKVTFQDAVSVLGISDRSFVLGFADALLASDKAKVLQLCHTLEAEGKDIAVFTLELMSHMRDIMLAMFAPESEQLLSLPNETQQKLKQQAQNADPQRVLRSIEILSRLESEIKLHSRPEIQLETAAVRITMPQLEDDLSALTDRVAMLEQQLKNGVPVQAQTAQTTQVPQGAQVPQRAQAADVPPWEAQPKAQQAQPAQAPKPAQPAQPAQAPKPAANGQWQAILNGVKQADLPLYMMIRSFSGVAQGEKYIIYIPENAKNKLELVTKNEKLLTDIINKVTGGSYKLQAEIGKSNVQSNGNSLMQAAIDLFS